MDSLTVALTQLSIKSPNTMGWMHLPGELRNRIYAYITLSFPYEIDVAVYRVARQKLDNNNLPKPKCKPFFKCFPGIAFANKQLNAELFPMLVQKTRFYIHSGVDAAYLDEFLGNLPVCARSAIQRLAFPDFARSLRYFSPRGRELALIQSCQGLKQLTITINTQSFLQFTTLGVLRPGGRVSTPTPTDAVINVERVAGLWGLSSLHELEHLEKFKMEFLIDTGCGYLLRAFRELAEWVLVHLAFATVKEGRVRNEVKQVRKHLVEFSGRHGTCDLAICMFLIERK
ncbi:uncharacterized protein K460DRAFT_393744 [Cucurbitaria berberidis CBS 394.84]|uniref:F-box domain-containing protein n=1 Tax=Cucurbitaria berberidis CBS 394.84 TaxID=1168544 RepID=A0A9P4GPD8_9PLEO|nr:uncharacterized protein K460DRAFT_393744 [Cucurbitaria berberidis CBS 394.84]KAF1848740.1 hypothetical protein K460DRAFT_393744 [Cucurbitaria berberidis CBS 394.84]